MLYLARGVAIETRYSSLIFRSSLLRHYLRTFSFSFSPPIEDAVVVAAVVVVAVVSH